ncbi:MAG: DNA alkylation repair protein [Planctomycetota bacterium]|nr:DNA alkylation repair protein [Planctomycetota bacterium]
MPPLHAVRARAKTIARDLRGDHAVLIARALTVARDGDEQLAFELFRAAPKAAAAMTRRQVESLLPVLHDWCSTDCFGCFVSGVAWREGALTDKYILAWTRSKALWTRRAALVSTVPLNLNARGSKAPKGDAVRTLAICERLVDDHEDMIVKALSWALRTLAPKDPAAVRAFLVRHEARLAARVLRETRNKLTTGLKNPKGRR